MRLIKRYIEIKTEQNSVENLYPKMIDLPYQRIIAEIKPGIEIVNNFKGWSELLNLPSSEINVGDKVRVFNPPNCFPTNYGVIKEKSRKYLVKFDEPCTCEDSVQQESFAQDRILTVKDEQRYDEITKRHFQEFVSIFIPGYEILSQKGVLDEKIEQIRIFDIINMQKVLEKDIWSV